MLGVLVYDGYCLSIVSFGFPVWKCLYKHLRGCRKTNLVPCLLCLLNSQTGSASVSTFLPVGKQTLYPCLLCLLNSQTGSASVSTFLPVGKQIYVPSSVVSFEVGKSLWSTNSCLMGSVDLRLMQLANEFHLSANLLYAGILARERIKVIRDRQLATYLFRLTEFCWFNYILIYSLLVDWRYYNISNKYRRMQM